MRDAGMTVVRVGDFAWSRLEPQEGRFDLDWLEAAVDLAAAHGLRCLLATPTAAPPAWLSTRYPETLAVTAQGRRLEHGNRAHASVTSPRYRELCRRVTSALAQRFGGSPAVLGWQVDNELNTVSYDEGTRRQFQDWLRGRYGTTDRLDEVWTTAFWSQRYDDWSQVPIPVGVHHPSLVLAWRRFLTQAFRDFLGVQADVIRAHARPGQWVSHNVMTFAEDFDQHEFAADLDVVGLDYYVGHLDAPDAGAAHDLVRGLKRRPYWLVEAQPGCGCWSPVNNVLDRGEARRLAWHAVGHGADAVLYWQWRSAPGGQEQYHGTLVGPDGLPRPFYEEASRVGRELAAAAPVLDGSAPAPQVAILHGYPDRWAIEAQRHHRDYDPVRHLLDLYRPLREAGHDVDLVAPTAPLEAYRLVVAPSLHLVDEELAARLLAWVRNGGVLLLGPRTGMKSPENTLLAARQPGPLAVGATVVEYYALDRPVPVHGPLAAAAGPDGGTARVWGEWLDPGPAGEVLLRYGRGNGWLDGRPAVVASGHGEGSVVLCGAWLDAGLTTALTARLLDRAGLHPPLEPVPDVEVCRRVRPDGGEVLVVVNHGACERTVPLPGPRLDLLTGRRHEDAMRLPANDVAVLFPAPVGAPENPAPAEPVPVASSDGGRPPMQRSIP
jgi:beta-galactosidase